MAKNLGCVISRERLYETILPYRATMPEISKYFSYHFRSLVMDALVVRAIVYTILTAAFIPLARLGFKKHQVSA